MYGTLELIKDALDAQGQFTGITDPQGEKSPSDVFQMLRQISFHLAEIADQMGMPAWAVPARVYEANCTQVVPMLRAALAAKTGADPKPFSFPKQPIRSIKPLDAFAVNRLVYANIAEFYEKESGYDPIVLEDPRTFKVSPGDVFDLTQIVIGELKALPGGARELDQTAADRYES